MKNEIKLDETTLPNDLADVTWQTVDGEIRKGYYYAPEHMFAYNGSKTDNVISDWDYAHYVDSWEYL